MNINEKLLESIFNEDLEQVKECLAQGANVNYDNGKICSDLEEAL